MENGTDKQYQVVLSYSTYASNPREALEIALSALDSRSAAYVEVFKGDESVLEGELPHLDDAAPEPATP